MGESRKFGLNPELDIEQILLEAHSRWLRPAEICEILRNYRSFQIAPEPPNRPSNGSLFLFDRKILRYFRKDGHIWRKKKDGKTVKEAHERLKVGSVDVLHCYYAHGEENENFQRRSYWMLEEDFMHIVLVHYRDVKGNKTSRSRNVDEIPRGVHDNSPVSSNSLGNCNQLSSQITDPGAPNSTQTSGYEDPETADNRQAISRYHPVPEMPQSDVNSMTDEGFMHAYFPVSSQYDNGDHAGRTIDFSSPFQDVLSGISDVTEHGLSFSWQSTQNDLAAQNVVSDPYGSDFQSYLPSPSTMLANLNSFPKRNTVIYSDVSASDLTAEQAHVSAAQTEETSQAEAKGGKMAEGDQCLMKNDSFTRWMSKELPEMEDSCMQSSSTSGICWETVESESTIAESSLSIQNSLYPYVLSPSVSKEQLFSIVDFSPSWAYIDLETKVLITGKFSRDKDDIKRYKWSCMFGEIEVPADVLADGILQCYSPPHTPGRVAFYISCSNRLACSEIREFEYLSDHAHYIDNLEFCSGSKKEMLFHVRLEKLLSLGTIDHMDTSSSNLAEKNLIRKKISSLLLEIDDGWSHMLKNTTEKEFFSGTSKGELLQKLLKEKLHAWLLCKVAEDGKGPNILDDEGQGVIHLAAALGYDWAIAPIVAAGVNINFRDVCGWSALHWAASCGRERTVVVLVSLGADPGALTDPTLEFPSGRTPADLASSNGQKGIAGFLAESSLTTHLSTLTLRESRVTDKPDISHLKVVEDRSEGSDFKYNEGDTLAVLSMNDSLSAVRNAAQAAARIHQVFRMQSFHRKKLVECDDDNLRSSDERVLSLISVKANKPSQHDEPVHAAAIRIQNKFRGWKGRKDFIITRQRIVKIQAHVRGHQVRKHFKKVVWSVGIVEKAILRWRRKGKGMRGFRSDALAEPSNHQSQQEEDDDYLRVGKKQAEARLEKALARVKSMVQYPEARDQYRRLITGARAFEESKVMLERILNETEEDAMDEEMLFDIEELLGDDNLMPLA